jgi:DNA-binding response OmpR family regulator
VTRVRAALGCTVSQREYWGLCFHPRDLVIDFVRQRVTLNGRELGLTATRHRLSSCLAHNAGKVLMLEQISDRAGGDYTAGSHTLRVNIWRLRKKPENDSKNPSYILTRPGLFMSQRDSISS